MNSIGTVREFHEDEGWGVIDAKEVPGGCWVFFSVIAMEGYRVLTAGERVRFTFERADQDGYEFRATTVWPLETNADARIEQQSGSSAYGSNLVLTYDEDRNDDST